MNTQSNDQTIQEMSPTTVTEPMPGQVSSAGPTVIFATGRRKTAVARVRLVPGSGKIVVNNRPLEDYFPVESHREKLLQPLTLTSNRERFDVFVNVRGGGVVGQAEAIRHGLARALVRVDQSLKPTLRAHGLLTRDPRMKERKKAGQPGARKRFQYSKR